MFPQKKIQNRVFWGLTQQGPLYLEFTGFVLYLFLKKKQLQEAYSHKFASIAPHFLTNP